jgi:hypothetical protein
MGRKPCPNCGKPVIGHPNKRFCETACKDRYWNRVNPRGLAAQSGPAESWDEYAATVHPFSGEAFEC